MWTWGDAASLIWKNTRLSRRKELYSVDDSNGMSTLYGNQKLTIYFVKQTDCLVSNFFVFNIVFQQNNLKKFKCSADLVFRARGVEIFLSANVTNQYSKTLQAISRHDEVVNNIK